MLDFALAMRSGKFSTLEAFQGAFLERRTV